MIIPYLGKIAIYLATLLALLTAIVYLVSWRGRENFTIWGRRFFYATAGSIFLAAFCLLQSILSHNFKVSYVYNYSSTDLPLYYLIATFWGGQEGTYLLWIFYISILGLILLKRSGKFEKGNFVFISLFILSVLLILNKRSPFALLPEVPSEGAGLNPLLQNYWMTIHPLVMFVGFAATVIPFAFALSALISRDYDSWVPFVFPWGILSFISLGTALVMGGFWAYETLGWGGYWAWDPVENSSLIPWLFSAGLIHTLIIHKKKNALKRTGFLLAILAFLSVVYGTFLTRSGVLGDFSVHSFLDLGINSYLIGSVIIFGLLGVGILLYRSKEIKGQTTASDWFSREFFVFGNILGFILSGFLVLLGMSSPLLTRWFGTPASVQTAYYNISITPIAIIVTFFLALFPAIGWGNNNRENFWKFLRIPLLISALVSLVIIASTVRKPLFAIFTAIAVFAFFSNGKIVWNKLKNGKVAGAFLAHAGLALLFIGVIFSNGYETRTRVSLTPGDPQNVFGYSFTYQGKDASSPQGKTPHKILVQKGSHSFVAAPKQFFSAYNQGIMRTPYIKRYWNKDLYIAPIEEVDHSVTEQTFSLQKGQETEIKGYKFKFVEFQVSPHQQMANQEVAAMLEVVTPQETQIISPKLVADGRGMRQEPARFNHDRVLVYLEEVQADQGTAVLRIIGQSANTAEIPQPGFAVEVSIKPFINLFWGGSILIVLGGLFSLQKRWKAVPGQKMPEIVTKEARPEPISEKVPV